MANRTGRKIWTVVATCALGALALTACSSGSNPPSASAKTTTTSTSPAATTTSTIAATTPSTTSGAPQNLPATADLKAELVGVYAAHNNIPLSQIAGTVPGSVYYAYLPSTKTYWAIASFEPTSTSSQQTQVAMQDDGCCGIFSTQTLTSFNFVSGFLGEPCTGQIPAELMTLWNLQSPGDCSPTTTTS
jgi:hypothetical protein